MAWAKELGEFVTIQFDDMEVAGKLEQMALLTASSPMVKPINGRSAVGGNPCFKNPFYCLLNPCKSANLDQESLIPERLKRWKLLV